MGQIVINIPTNKNLHYEIESKQECKNLIKMLNEISGKINGNERLSEEELDFRDGMEALAAKKRNDFIRWDDVRSQL
jgi:hypothetical protein